MQVLIYIFSDLIDEVVIYSSKVDAQIAADAWAQEQEYDDYEHWREQHGCEDKEDLKWWIVELNADDATGKILRWFRDALNADRPDAITVPVSMQRAVVNAWEGAES